MKLCREPFENVEITNSGDVFFCCAHDVQHNYIGNINKQSFDEIWNSPKAIEIRTKILNNDYSCCSKEFCYRLSNPDLYFDEKKEHFTPKVNQYPLEIKLMHDLECNVNCIFCREHILRNSDEELQKYNKLTETTFIPMLKDARLLTANAGGDSLASRHTRELIKKVAKTYPKIKFEILTNGILASPSIIRELGIEDRMTTVFVSFHATTKQTYDKIVKNGNFEQVIKNIKYLSELRQKGKLDCLQFNFVVNKYNYKEMPDFIRLSREHYARPSFWEVRKYNEFVNKQYNDLAVHLKEHPEHQNFIKILEDPIFDTLESHELYPILANLRTKKQEV